MPQNRRHIRSRLISIAKFWLNINLQFLSLWKFYLLSLLIFSNNSTFSFTWQLFYLKRLIIPALSWSSGSTSLGVFSFLILLQHDFKKHECLLIFLFKSATQNWTQYESLLSMQYVCTYQNQKYTHRAYIRGRPNSNATDCFIKILDLTSLSNSAD